MRSRGAGNRVAIAVSVAAMVTLASCSTGQPGSVTLTGQPGAASSPGQPGAASSPGQPGAARSTAPVISPSGAPVAPAGVPTIAGGPGHCENPRSVQDVTLGAYLAIEATADPSKATFDGFGSIVPLTDVKILWQAVPHNVPPRTIEAGNVPLADAELIMPAGRYVLLLGSGHAGHWYLAMGRSGAFAFVDPRGSELTQLCTVYTATPQPPTKAPGSVRRTQLLALLQKAPLPDARYSPPA